MFLPKEQDINIFNTIFLSFRGQYSTIVHLCKVLDML